MGKKLLVFVILLSGLLFYGCAMQGVLYQNAENAYERGDNARAKELFLEFIQKYPKSEFAPKAKFRLAQIYVRETNWDEALKYFDMVTKEVKGGWLDAQSRTEMARIRKARKEIADAQYIYDNNPGTEKGNKEASQALYKMAKAYETLKEYEKAIETYEKLLKEFPDFELAAQVQNQIGVIYFYRLYDYEKGWEAFQKVIKGYPGTDLANQAERTLKEAQRTLEQIQAAQLSVDQVAKKTALEFEDSGRHVTQFDKYGIKTDQVAQDYITIAVGWERLKNYPNAIKAYLELANELPFEQAAPNGLFKAAELYQEMGDYEMAVKTYDELFKRYPQSIRRAEAVYNQAIAYETMREFEKAYDLYRLYVSLDNTDENAKRRAEEKISQLGYDEDGDGYPFYKEAQYGTSDKDPTSYPSS